MKDNRQKEQMFRTLREALRERNYIPDCDPVPAGSIFVKDDEDDLSVLFAQNFTRAGGVLHYCSNENDISNRIKEIQHSLGDCVIGCASDNLNGFLEHLNIENRATSEMTQNHKLGATLCEALIAWQGSIVISSNLGLGTNIPTLPENTIVIAFTSQVVADWMAANERLKQLYKDYPDQIMIAHPASYAYRKGQQKLYLILIEDEAT